MIKSKIASVLAGGAKLTRSQIIAASGLTVDQVRYHLRSVATPAQSTGGRGAVWTLKDYAPEAPKQPQTVNVRITAALDAAGPEGLYVAQIVSRHKVSQSQAKIVLARGLEAGLYAWHSDRSERSAARRRWYLAQHKPDHAPQSWKKQPKKPRVKAAMTAIKKMPAACTPKSGKALWQPGQTVERNGVKVTPCPCGIDQRFTFTPPPGWVGEITRDWMAANGRPNARLTGPQRPTKE